MKKSDLLKIVSEKAGITVNQAEKALDAYYHEVKRKLAKDGSVTTSGFGTISVTKVQASKGSRSDQPIHQRSKRSIQFKPAKALAEEVVKSKITPRASKISKSTFKIEKKASAKKSAIDKKMVAKKKAAKKAAAKKAAPAKQVTMLDTVFDAIKRTKKGVTVAQLREKSKLDSRQLSNALYKLTKKGVIQTKSRGLYVKK